MEKPDTLFAPAERADSDTIQRDAESLQSHVLADDIVHIIPSIVMILNKQRQVVYKNQRLNDYLSTTSDHEIIGKRPGELLNCTHAHETEAGCGTTEFCGECGAVKAVLKSQKDKNGVVEEECRITSLDGNIYDFRVWASPYTFKGEQYTVFSLEDIRHEKRRLALEQTFFHDINNILNGLVSCSSLLDSSTFSKEIAEPVDIIKFSAQELAKEIESHRKLLQAEDRQLSVELSHSVIPSDLIDELVHISGRTWPNQPVLRSDICEDFTLTTDRSILFRVLYNMVKNAFEASSSSEVVSIRCIEKNSSAVFSVHNSGFMPKSTQFQVFQRSFSTKGKGRGIGTYSMKLFGEDYLKGKVWFNTSKTEGTTFFISIPLSCEEA